MLLQHHDNCNRFAFLVSNYLFCGMIKMMKQKLSQYADQIGFTGSLFCLIHCILTSGVIVVSSAVSHIDEHEHHSHVLDIWGYLDISMIIISGIAVYFAARKTFSEPLKMIMWSFYCLYAASMLVKYTGYEPMWLAVLSYVASFGLIISHLVNLKLTHTKQPEVCTC